MDVTWGSYHRRQEILRAVAHRAEHDARRPWQGVPGLRVEFESDVEVLQELHHWWLRVLIARLQGLEMDACPERVYDEVAAAHPGLRAVLEEYADHPCLAESLRRERALLCSAVAA